MFKITLRRLLKRKPAVIGLIIVLLLIVMIIFATSLAPYDPYYINLREVLHPPSLRHPFGTDELGRDILSRIVYGSRLTSLVGVSGIALGMLVGCSLGLVSGYYGGLLDDSIMRFIDVLYAFPGMITAIIIIAIIGTGIWNVALAIGIFSISIFARITRAGVLEVKAADYVEAARALGASDFWIIRRHILVNILMSIVIMATVRLAQAVLVATSLSFLGLGVAPGTPEWGAMLSSGRAFLQQAPHITIFPGLFIFLNVLGVNLVGDGIRDVIDPRYRSEE